MHAELRQELRLRMSAQLGMDADTLTWIARTVCMLHAVDVEREVEHFRLMQGTQGRP